MVDHVEKADDVTAWASLALALVRLAGAVFAWARDRKLIAAGEDKAVADGMRNALAKIEAANAARARADAANAGAGLRDNDGYRRD